MIPELVGSPQSSPFLLTMKGLVGQYAANDRDDVRLVQSLLVDAQGARGNGSTRPLEVDGLVGPATIAAITTYQKLNGLKADGLVGPRGETIHSLLALAGRSGRLASRRPRLDPAPPKVVQSFTGAQTLAGRVNRSTVTSFVGGSSFGAPFTPTTWKIAKAATVDVSWKDQGAFVGHLDMVDDASGETVHVVIRGVLAVASKGSPFGFDISLPSDPSSGGRIIRGLGGIGFSKTSFFGPCGVSMAGFEAGVGYGFTLFQFGWAPAPPGMCNGFTVTAGYQHGIPSIGVASGIGLATPV